LQATDLLQTFAEIGIGLAGFTGIVAALQTRGDGASSALRAPFRYLIIYGVATVLFALLPLVLLLVLSEPSGWRSASAMFLAAHLAVFVPYWLPGSQQRADARALTTNPWWVELVMASLMILIMLGLGSVAAGFFAGQAEFIYAASLLFALGNGLVNFVQLLTDIALTVHEGAP
jgi:hypothetical protein